MSQSRPDTTRLITRGAMRYLRQAGYSVIREFSLKNNRRADIIGVDRKGKIVIVEVKSSREDFQTDGKWEEYLPFCDRFLFAVAQDFPDDLIPEDIGLMITDEYFAEIIRDGQLGDLNATRRKAIMLDYGRKTAERLYHLERELDLI